MKKVVKTIGFILYSILVPFLILELGIRFWQGIPFLTTDNFIIQQLDLVRQNTGVMVHDPLLGWRLTEDYSGGSFTTGSYGLRMNSNEIRPLAKGGILAVGDSFTAGSGVQNDKSWPAQLEQAINRPVHNAAAGAWGVDQMVLRAEQLVPALLPEVLIVSILGQDSLRNAYEIYGGGYKPYFVIQNGEAVLKGVPTPRVSDKPMNIGPIRWIFGRSFLIHWTMIRLEPTSWIDNSYRYKKIILMRWESKFPAI